MSEQLPLDLPERVQQTRLSTDEAFMAYYLDVMSKRPQRPIGLGDRVLHRTQFLGIGIVRMPENASHEQAEWLRSFSFESSTFYIVRVEWLDYEGQERFSLHYARDLVRIGRSSSHLVEGKVIE